MAKKDTMKALVNRGIREETAVLLLTKYNTLSSIGSADKSDLLGLGLTENEVKLISIKIGKKPSSPSYKIKKNLE